MLQECRKIILVIPAHNTSSDQTFLTRTFMQECCFKNINVKPVSLRSTPCSHISLIMFEYALGCYHLFRWYSRPHRRMLLDEMNKNDFEEISWKPKIKESLNPDSLRSFLHKVTESNKMSV